MPRQHRHHLGECQARTRARLACECKKYAPRVGRREVFQDLAYAVMALAVSVALWVAVIRMLGVPAPP